MDDIKVDARANRTRGEYRRLKVLSLIRVGGEDVGRISHSDFGLIMDDLETGDSYYLAYSDLWYAFQDGLGEIFFLE